MKKARNLVICTHCARKPAKYLVVHPDTWELVRLCSRCYGSTFEQTPRRKTGTIQAAA